MRYDQHVGAHSVGERIHVHIDRDSPSYNRVSAKLGPLRSQPSGLRSEQMNFM